MARLMRAIPELCALTRGIKEASRAVCSSLLMLTLRVYFFSISIYLLVQGESNKSAIITGIFNSVPTVMLTLLVDGAFLDGLSIVPEAS